MQLEERIEDLPGNLASGEWLRVDGHDEARETVAAQLASAEYAFARLRKILRKRFLEEVRRERDVDNPGYPSRVAYVAGYTKALQEVYRLITTTTFKDQTK
jgi:hypothetical protein